MFSLFETGLLAGALIDIKPLLPLGHWLRHSAYSEYEEWGPESYLSPEAEALEAY